MLKFEIQGLDRLQRQLEGLGKDIPRAVAAGLNRTMSAVEQHELNAMERAIDRPSGFTMNALGVFKATPSRPETTLFVKDIQAGYLRPNIEGGTYSGIEPVLSNVPLDRLGNLPGKAARRGGPGGLAGIAARRKGRFVKKIGGRLAVWERQGPRLKAIAVIDRASPRRPILPFFETAARVVEQRLERDVSQAIGDVLRG